MLGWFYQDGFFRWFGVEIDALDLPVYNALLSSLIPLTQLFDLLLPIGTVLAVALLTPTILRAILRSSSNRPLLGRMLNKRTRKDAASEKHDEDPRSLELNPLILDSILIFLSSLLAFASLALLIIYADWRGRTYAKAVYVHPSTKVTLVFNEEHRKSFDADLLKANSEGALRVLDQTKDLIVVFVKSDFRRKVSGAFAVPVANIEEIHLEPLGDE